MVLLHPIFVAHHLAVELVHHIVHSSVQVLVGRFGKQIIALDVDVAFGALALFFFFFVFLPTTTL